MGRAPDEHVMPAIGIYTECKMDDKDIQVAERFFSELKKLLNETDDDFKKFMGYFDTGQYREAYLFLEEITEKKKLKLTDSFLKARESFYWVFVN